MMTVVDLAQLMKMLAMRLTLAVRKTFRNNADRIRAKEKALGRAERAKAFGALKAPVFQVAVDTITLVANVAVLLLNKYIPVL